MRLPVRAVIYFYIFICVVLLLFNLLYIFRSGSVKRRQKRRVHRWEGYLASFLEGSPVWDSDELFHRLKDTEELMAFYTAMGRRIRKRMLWSRRFSPMWSLPFIPRLGIRETHWRNSF